MSHLRSPALVAGCLLLSAARASGAVGALETVAERSGFRITGRYEEVERLCRAYASTWPDAVRCTEFGRTPEGRPMLALIVSRSGALTPEDARERNMPVLLIQGGIHAGEIDGKDAGFLATRELLQGKASPDALQSFVLVFVPVFNVDGHERFGRWNRPNQSGPEEMGWRTTAQNLNLNRDYAKADAPEMQAMLRLLDAWDPVLYVDLHVTDGAQFQPDVANLVEPVRAGDRGTAGRGSRAQQRAQRSACQAGRACRSTSTRRSWWTTIPHPDLRSAYRSSAFRRATGPRATALPCWWRRIPGRITRRGCASRATPS